MVAHAHIPHYHDGFRRSGVGSARVERVAPDDDHSRTRSLRSTQYVEFSTTHARCSWASRSCTRRSCQRISSGIDTFSVEDRAVGRARNETTITSINACGVAQTRDTARRCARSAHGRAPVPLGTERRRPGPACHPQALALYVGRSERRVCCRASTRHRTSRARPQLGARPCRSRSGLNGRDLALS